MPHYLSNCSFYENEILNVNQQLVIEGEKIRAIIPADSESVKDGLVVPGFIDLQIYGAGGKLFSADPSVETLSAIEDTLLRTGTTGFLICMATNTPEVFHAGIAAAKAHRAVAKNCLGLHLEGPFLNPKRKGAHVAEYIRKATLDEIKALLDFGDGIIKMMTIAAELQDEKVVQYLLDHGVVLSLGHSDASFEEAITAYNQGVQSTTHLFNAMSPLQHRAPGIPAAVFNHDKARASMIADGHHVDFEIIKLSYKLLKERLFLITDAVTECAAGPYQHQWAGDKFVMPDGTLSGSALTMLQALRNVVEHAGIPLAEAIKMASLYPAQLIGEQHRIGSIVPGNEANLLVLDEKLGLKQVYFKGEKILA